MGLEIVAMYLAVGAVAGVIAGLLGVGGGLVIVPILAICFPLQGIDHAQVMHLALGTSLASIIFTSISSLLAHNRRGAVDWSIFRRIVPGVLLGTFLGAMVASHLSTGFLKGFFCVFLYSAATQMFFGKKPKASRELPAGSGMFGVGSVIGVVSALVGIGGGSLSVPFFVWCNVNAHAGSRDFGRHWSANCACRRVGLHDQQSARGWVAVLQRRLCLSAGFGWYCLRLSVHRSLGSETGACPACG